MLHLMFQNSREWALQELTNQHVAGGWKSALAPLFSLPALYIIVKSNGKSFINERCCSVVKNL